MNKLYPAIDLSDIHTSDEDMLLKILYRGFCDKGSVSNIKEFAQARLGLQYLNDPLPTTRKGERLLIWRLLSAKNKIQTTDDLYDALLILLCYDPLKVMVPSDDFDFKTRHVQLRHEFVLSRVDALAQSFISEIDINKTHTKIVAHLLKCFEYPDSKFKTVWNDNKKVIAILSCQLCIAQDFVAVLLEKIMDDMESRFAQAV